MFADYYAVVVACCNPTTSNLGFALPEWFHGKCPPFANFKINENKHFNVMFYYYNTCHQFFHFTAF